MISLYLERVLAKADLGFDDAVLAMNGIIDGLFTQAQTGALLVGLRMKGETAEEIAGFVHALRARAATIRLDGVLVDTCGTGGDGRSSFNVSTAAAFLVAASGVRVAKHGNGAVSSRSGSADVLRLLGAQVDLAPDAVETCIHETGIGFLFAPRMHPTFRTIGPIRRELGVRTVFNLLGPLLNPAPLTHQVIGVHSPQWVLPLGQALSRMKRTRALVVHGDGFDEIALSGETLVCEVTHEETRTWTLTPEDFGLDRLAKDALTIASPEEGARCFRRALTDLATPYAQSAIANAAAALWITERTDSLLDAAELAKDAIRSGRAAALLDAFIRKTNEAP